MTNKRGDNTWQEIISQPKAWVQAIEVVRSQANEINNLWKRNPETRVIFTGCGSTYYLSLAAASLFQMMTGREARAIPAGELVLYPQSAYGQGTPYLLVAISRSGSTSETIKAVGQFIGEGRGPVMVITNYGDAPLATMSDMSVVIPAGQEKSVAQTRSFTSMYVAVTALTSQVAGRSDLLNTMEGLPTAGERILESSQSFALSLGENLALDRFYFLGGGPRYGLACEISLKMKEMSLTHSEPFHFFEFRHGPMSMVTETAAVIGLRSPVNSSHEQAVLYEMKEFGGHVISLSEADADLSFSSWLPKEVLNVLYLPVLQLTAFYRSIAKGLNPDQPHNLSSVVELDLTAME